MNPTEYQELATLFFTTRQIIRQKLPGKPDPNAWLRFETLRYIGSSHGPTMHQIAAYLRIQAPSATSLMRNLFGRGLIERRTVKGDKRLVRIALTAKGRARLKAHERMTASMMREVFFQCSERDVRELSRVLRRLRDVHEAKSRKMLTRATSGTLQ